jgi:hypothetical protein
MGKWIRISDAMFCGMRIGETDNLSDVEPFRLVAQAIADKVIPRGDATVAVAGVRVEGNDQFVILAFYGKAPCAG